MGKNGECLMLKGMVKIRQRFSPRRVIVIVPRRQGLSPRRVMFIVPRRQRLSPHRVIVRKPRRQGKIAKSAQGTWREMGQSTRLQF